MVELNWYYKKNLSLILGLQGNQIFFKDLKKMKTEKVVVTLKVKDIRVKFFPKDLVKIHESPVSGEG